MKLRLTRKAATKVDHVLTHLAFHSPQGIRNLQSRIQAVARLLVQHPEIGRLTSRNGMRRIVAAPYPHLIFYKTSRDQITVHGIRHAAREFTS